MPVWSEIRKAGAGDVLRIFNVFQPPVDVLDLAWRMGVDVYLVKDLRERCGAVDANPETGEARILINHDSPSPRRRFKVAHELGHLLLHEGIAYRGRDMKASDWEEAQANHFAAKLLMPSWMVKAYFDTSPDPHALAAAFEVEYSDMMARLATLRVL